jgi:flagellar protein FlaI
VGDTSDRSDQETEWSDVVDGSDDTRDGDATLPPADLLDGNDATRSNPAADADAMVVEEGHDVPPPERSVLEDVLSFFEDSDDPFAPAPDEAFVRERFFDLEYREGRQEVERYWLNEPFAYASVLYDEDVGDYRYRVTEPTLSEFERYVRADMIEDLRDVLLHVDPGDSDRGEVLDGEIQTLSDRYARQADPGSLHKIRYYIRRDLLGYDRIDPLLNDQRLEDISCDGVDVPVYVYHNDYRDLQTNVSFPEEELNSFVVRLAQRSDRHISVADPMIDASLPNGSRVQMTLGREVSTRGSNFTIRQFADVPITPIDLIKWGTFSVETMTYLWLAIESNLSLVFAGGTAAGKTTSMNAVSMFIPPRTKVITIEDTREITLPHDNWIQSVTREGFLSDGGGGDIDMYQLLQAALRQRPEYLLVGEIRTEEDVALAFFQAMSTGHTAYTTMHADSTETVLSRLQNPPLNVPRQMVQELDIVAIQRQIFVGNRRVRRNVRLSELSAAQNGISTRDVYKWNPASDTMQQQGESRNIADIMHMRGWDRSELEHELARRERLLTALVERDITGYEPFTDIVHRYHTSPDEVMELLAADQLERLT